MELSIIIVSWRVKELLKECLSSIFEHLKDIDFEVIVIDNNSGDGTVEMVQQNFHQVKLIPNQINLGFAKANNLGIKKASGKYILFLNPDTKFIDNSINQAINQLKSDQSIGVLGCKLLNYDQTLQSSVRRFPRFRDHFLMMFKLHHLFPLKHYFAKDFDYNKIQEVDQVMGAFFLMNRQTVDKVGNWDDGYYLWFDEVDYCQRVKKAGFKVVYYPDAKLIHYSGQSFKKVSPILNIKKQWIFSKTRLKYILKHQNPLVYLVILILTPVSLLLSLIAPRRRN